MLMKLTTAFLSLAMSENLRHLSLSTSSKGGLFSRNAYAANFKPNLMWKNLKVLISSDPVIYPENLSIKLEKIEVLDLLFPVKHNFIFDQLHEMKKLRVLNLMEFVHPDNAAEIASRIIPGSFTQLETIRWGMPVSVLYYFWWFNQKSNIIFHEMTYLKCQIFLLFGKSIKYWLLRLILDIQDREKQDQWIGDWNHQSFSKS